LYLNKILDVHPLSNISVFVPPYIVFPSYLFEYIWREKVKREGGDHFLSLLGLLADMRTRVTPAEELPQVTNKQTNNQT
jgi:hypothetical protein